MSAPRHRGAVEAFRLRARAWIHDNLRRLRQAASVGVLRNDRTDEEELEPSRPRPRDSSACCSTPGSPACASPPPTAARASPRPTSRRSTRSWPASSTPVAAPGARPSRPAPRCSSTSAPRSRSWRHLPAILRGRRAVDAVPVRAERRLGRGRCADHRRARRRRVGAERFEGVDHRRLVVRLGPVPGPDQLGRAQAPGAHVFMLPDPPARHRGAPHRDAERLQGVLPGVHDRRAGPRHRPHRRGGRRLDGRDPVDVPRAHAPQLPLRDHPGRDGPQPASARRRCSRWPASAGRLDDPCGPRPGGRGPHARAGRPASSSTASPRACAPRAMSDQSAAIGRLFAGVTTARTNTHRLRARRRDGGGVDRRRRRAGRLRVRLPACARSPASAVAPPRWPATSISERVLGMPRERTLDRDVPFRDVPRSPRRDHVSDRDRCHRARPVSSCRQTTRRHSP